MGDATVVPAIARITAEHARARLRDAPEVFAGARAAAARSACESTTSARSPAPG